MLQLEQELYGLMESVEADRKKNETISFDAESDEPQDPRMERIGEILTLLEVLHWEDYKRIVISKFNVPADYFEDENDEDQKELCDACNGAGEDRYEQRCRFCRGKGVIL